QLLGTAVFAGMIGVTAFGLIFTPIFYVVCRWLAEKTSRRRALPAAPAAPADDAQRARREGAEHGGRRRAFGGQRCGQRAPSPELHENRKARANFRISSPPEEQNLAGL